MTHFPLLSIKVLPHRNVLQLKWENNRTGKNRRKKRFSYYRICSLKLINDILWLSFKTERREIYMDYLITLLKHDFENNRNELQAEPMKKYMKNLFPFLGIKKPERVRLMKSFFQQTGILKTDFQPDFVQQLWELPEREYQYAALDYIGKSLKKLDDRHLSLMEKLITSKSWWDTVDMLAQKPVGTIAKMHPKVILETINGWAFGENIWLRRAAILFQLKYKEQTDEQLLYQYIIHNSDSQEFFIQKAIGLALREYSKTNPQSVKTFIHSHPLPSLSVREGKKYL